MFSLFCEAKFWTLKNDIQTKNTDLSVLRYYDKKEVDECPLLEGKKLYCDQRGTTFVLKNKRPFKLRDRLKEFEQQLINNKVVLFSWKDDNILYVILNTGLIIDIGVNIHSKDLYKITFDRFLVGKLLSENVCDILFTNFHLVISYNENQLTLVSFSKPWTKSNPCEKLAKLEPKIQHVDLCGPSGRRLDRKLSANKAGDCFLTWWHSTKNEVYPWSPLVKDEDRANLHIYSLVGVRIELLCFYRTESDLMNVKFSQIKPNLVWVIEQRVTKKGDVSVDYASYEIVKKVFKKVSVTSIPLQSQMCCHSISPDEERLVLGCLDGSLILLDEPRGVTRLVKSSFIPNYMSWHNDGALVVVANERSQFQFFDIALSCVRSQWLSDDVTPSNLLELSSFFKTQQILLHIKWNKKGSATCYTDKFIPNDHLLLLIFENGPFGVLNLIGGGGLYNDVQNLGLTPDTLIRLYLLYNQTEKALNVLLSLNWNTKGSTCLAGLYHIANHVFRHPFTPEGENFLELGLGSFYAPVRPLTRFTENEFGNQIHDLTRRFFHFLLRHQLYEKAYCLAIDLSNVDLFVDLFHCAKLLEDKEMAFACRTKIEELNCSDNSSHSNCSQSPCSCSESCTEDEEDGILPPLPQVSVKKSQASRVPPLPDLNRHTKLRESAFFNYNRPYLPSEPEINNSFDSQIASTSFTEYYPSIHNVVQKPPDYKYSTTQILTPEHPHSYEIRTSFSRQEDDGSSNFTPSETNSRTTKSSDGFSSRANVIESLYDLPSNMSNLKDQATDFTLSRSEPCFSNFGPLKLKSQVQFHASSFSPSTDYFPPPGPPKALRPPLLNFNPMYPSPRCFTPRPQSFITPQKQFNNTALQKPLHFVPNFPRQVLKPVTPSIAKQKVKFSDTVTHILVSDLSKISIEDETLLCKSRVSRNSNQSELNANHFQPVENLNKIGLASQTDHQEEEGNNGTIKVIHFGVV